MSWFVYSHFIFPQIFFQTRIFNFCTLTPLFFSCHCLLILSLSHFFWLWQFIVFRFFQSHQVNVSFLWHGVREPLFGHVSVCDFVLVSFNFDFFFVILPGPFFQIFDHNFFSLRSDQDSGCCSVFLWPSSSPFRPKNRKKTKFFEIGQLTMSDLRFFKKNRKRRGEIRRNFMSNFRFCVIIKHAGKDRGRTKSTKSPKKRTQDP